MGPLAALFSATVGCRPAACVVMDKPGEPWPNGHSLGPRWPSSLSCGERAGSVVLGMRLRPGGVIPLTEQGHEACLLWLVSLPTLTNQDWVTDSTDSLLNKLFDHFWASLCVQVMEKDRAWRAESRSVALWAGGTGM